MRTAPFALFFLVACGTSDAGSEWEPGPDGLYKAETTANHINTLTAGANAERLLDSAKSAAFIPDARTLRITFTGSVKDRLGNIEPLPMFSADFRAADIRAAKLENLDAWDTLDLASSVTPLSGIGREMIKQSCDGNLHPNFCAKALSN